MCAYPINLCNSLGSGLSDLHHCVCGRGPWLESVINFPFLPVALSWRPSLFPLGDSDIGHDTRSKRLLILWMQSPSAVILEAPKITSVTVSTVSPSISHEVMGPDAMILVFWMLRFKPTFSLSSFTFIKRLFSSSSLSVSWLRWTAQKRSQEKLPLIQGQGRWQRVPGCNGAGATERSCSMSKVRGSGWEAQPHIQGVAAGPHRRPERSYSTFKVRRGHLSQGKKQQLCFAGAVLKRYPTCKVRETQVRR